MIDKGKTISYWRSHAEYDLETAQSLFSVKRYPYCLFMCHLAIEKALKALVVIKTDEHAPYTHNLPDLAARTGLDFTEQQINLIAELNEFNMEARYPKWHLDFYAQATESFTKGYLDGTTQLYLWLTK